MKLRLSYLVSITTATVAALAVLALLGVKTDVGTTQAASTPTPIPPVVGFTSAARDSVSSTALGLQAGDPTIAHALIITDNNQGKRVALPWIFAGPGFWVRDYNPATEGSNVGTVWSTIDVNCDSIPDALYNTSDGPPVVTCNDKAALPWQERDIALALDPTESYLSTIMPPFTWVFRQRADIANVCVYDPLTELYSPIAAPSVLNTVFETLPNTPLIGGHPTSLETTILGGSPGTPPSRVCLDSPQSSESDNTIRHNPPVKGDAVGGPGGVGGRALDNNSGLYVKWTIFMSMGSASLNKYGDLRAAFKSPPSIASDVGYVERTVQMDCWWLDSGASSPSNDGCSLADCDAVLKGGNNDGYISAAESWADPDLLAMTGTAPGPTAGATAKAAIDANGDCIMRDTMIQQDFVPSQTVAADTLSGVNCDSVPANNWVKYSENPVVHNDTSADTDCDGLLNGIEWAYGSNPTLKDSDSDGAPDFVEMFQFSDPNDTDTDNDGYADKPAGVYLNDGTGKDIDGNIVPADHSVDNCPIVANGTLLGPNNQLNTDGARRAAGPNLHSGALLASNPNQDKLGDACDPDDDNDGAMDPYELLGVTPPTDPLKMDTDADTVNDGVELRLQLVDPFSVDALDPDLYPTWSSTDQVYYRGCQINVAAYPAAQNNDIDGDGINCTTTGDLDSDNGTGSGAAVKPEVPDSVESFGYNTSIAAKDTDGDGCADWVEISDINGDRTADSGDQFDLSYRIYHKTGIYPPLDPMGNDRVFDLNKDEFVDSGDQLQMNQNVCPFKTNTGGCPICNAEN